MIVTIENMQISSISMGASENSSRQTETVRVKFDKMTLEYIDFSDGKGGKSQIQTVDVVNCK